MSSQDRKEAAVRKLLESTQPTVPPDLYDEAVRRGRRVLWQRTAARRAMWLVLCVLVVSFTVWACVAHPWVEPPSDTTPPLTGW